jgi:hypothetical protein
VGVDDKWISHVHYFEQEKTVKATGITRSLIWKKDVPTALTDLLKDVGATEIKKPPLWVAKLFDEDKEIIERANQRNSNA